jgi:SapC
MNRLVPVREVSQLRLVPPRDDCWVDDLGWIPVSATEIHLACRYYPIAVRFDGPTPRLGLIVGGRYLAHKLVDSAGAWRGAYRPIGLRCFPFSAPQLGGDPLHDILVDADSPCLSASTGIPLVDGSGRAGPFLNELHRFFSLLKQGEDAFSPLLDLFQIGGLLAPLATVNDDAVENPQLFVLDPARLLQMKPAALAAMARHGILSVNIAVASHFSLLNLRPEYRPKQTTGTRRDLIGSASTAPAMVAIDDLALALDDGELVSLWNIQALGTEAPHRILIE